jgi:hypothetical protein
LRCRFAEGDLVAHFPHRGGECFNLLLLLCSGRLLSRNLLLLLRDRRLEIGDCALLFCDVPVLFEKLVQHHRVHRFVAHGREVSLLVARNQGFIEGERGPDGSGPNTSSLRHWVIAGRRLRPAPIQ